MNNDDLQNAMTEIEIACYALSDAVKRLQWAEPKSELDREERAKIRQAKAELQKALGQLRP